MFNAQLKTAALGAVFAAALAFAQQGPPPAQPREMVSIFPGTNGVPAGDYNSSARSAADEALPDSYGRDETFFKIPKSMKLGGASGIAIDKDGHSIWVYQRCGGQGQCIGSHDPVLWKFDSNGNLVKAIVTDQIIYPHGLYVAPDGNLWVTDLKSNVDLPSQTGGNKDRGSPTNLKPNGADVLEFSPDGKLLMRLGTAGVYGTDDAHFSEPSAVAVAPHGDIFVADGHEGKQDNNRIMKFDKSGKFLKSWPTCQPTDAQQTDCSHALAIDSQGRLFVANRGNNVIDIFDKDGKLLDQWKQFGRPSGLFIDKNDVLYAGDSESSVLQGNAFIRGIHVGDARTGVVKAFLPDLLGNPVPWNPLRGTTGPEGVAAADGYIYASQVTPSGLVRYSPR